MNEARKPDQLCLARRTLLKSAATGAAFIALPTRAATRPTLPTSLAVAAAIKGITFGSTINAKWLHDKNYVDLISHNCAIATAENAMKWKYLERNEGKYATRTVQSVTDFAKQKGIASRGHCFVWNDDRRMPEWLVEKAGDWNKDQQHLLASLMWKHGAFLQRKFPHVTSWDVVNEAIYPREGVIRDSVLSRMLGERFIDIAFRVMKAKAPHARLVYNETMSWEKSSRHRDAVLGLLERLLKRNVPIDTLGIQSHIGNTLNKPRNEVEWRRFLEDVQAMGLDVILTELDCSDRNITDSDPYRRDIEAAAFTKGYLDITLDFPNVRQIVLWSIADKPSYMNRNGYPLDKRRADGQALRGHPFDENWQPKPMYHAIMQALKSAPLRASGGISV